MVKPIIIGVEVLVVAEDKSPLLFIAAIPIIKGLEALCASVAAVVVADKSELVFIPIIIEVEELAAVVVVVVPGGGENGGGRGGGAEETKAEVEKGED